MERTKTSLNLMWLTIVVTLAVLATAPVHATAASNIRGSAPTVVRADVPAASAKAGSRHLTRNQLRPKQASASYFWIEAGILVAVFAGIVLLGLWGDIAIGCVVFGIWVLTAASGLATRKAYLHIRQAFVENTASGTPTPHAPTTRT